MESGADTEATDYVRRMIRVFDGCKFSRTIALFFLAENCMGRSLVRDLYAFLCYFSFIRIIMDAFYAMVMGGCDRSRQRGKTALIHAADHGHIQCVRLLVESGANSDAKGIVRVCALGNLF